MARSGPLTRVNGRKQSPAQNGAVSSSVVSSQSALPGRATVNSIRALLLCLLSVLVPGRADAADSLQQLMAKVASAYGHAPGAIRETGTTFSVLEGEGSLLRLYKFPDRFHVEIAYAVARDDRTMIGAQAWNKNAPANRMAHGAIVLQAARIALPWSLLSRQSVAIDRGAASAPNDRTVHVIEVPLQEALTMLVDIDPETGYIVRSRGMYVTAGTAIEFATLFSDFRKENGRVHAAREEQFAAGTRTGYSFIDKIEYLDSLPDSAFAPWTSADSGHDGSRPVGGARELKGTPAAFLISAPGPHGGDRMVP